MTLKKALEYAEHVDGNHLAVDGCYPKGDPREARDAWLVAGDAAEEAGDERVTEFCRTRAAWWMRFLRDTSGPGEHLHSCTRCYEDKSCEYTCSIEEDLRLDDGTPRGCYYTCEDCVMKDQLGARRLLKEDGWTLR